MPDLSFDSTHAGGVQSANLIDLLTVHELFVFLRARLVVPAHWDALVSSAKGHRGLPYDYVGCVRAVAMTIGRSTLARLVRFDHPPIRPPADFERACEVGRALVCSDFVWSVYDEVFQDKNPCNLSGGRPHGLTVPSEFFCNPKFGCVGL